MKCEKKPVTGNKNTPTKLILPQCARGGKFAKFEVLLELLEK